MKSVLKFSFQLRFILTSSSLGQNMQRNYFASCMLADACKIYLKVNCLHCYLSYITTQHHFEEIDIFFLFLFGDLLQVNTLLMLLMYMYRLVNIMKSQKSVVLSICISGKVSVLPLTEYRS